ncbi:MAG: glycoside hydrolase family 16 protein [Phycisphaeraceae bacterium]|nr:glycoside hydrolase family 16 protein [Phycisphaeraceae bacterium]
MRTYAWLIISLVCMGTLQAADWIKVWSDEFNTEGLPDTSKWNYEQGFVRNQEAQYYTRARRENARVENGHLVIEARKESWPNPGYDAGASSRRWQRSRKTADYTSASLVTKQKATWTYGRIEVRAKLPQGRGVWPAIWMLGTNISDIGWPACGEIDIMEYVGYDPNTIHANVHMKKYNHSIGTGKGSKIATSKPYNQFHVYAVEWTAERMEFFFDDQKYFSFSNEHSGFDAWPFDKPHYLILNLAIGGSWGGQKGIDASIFPQTFLIDYVRVYQKKSD